MLGRPFVILLFTLSTLGFAIANEATGTGGQQAEGTPASAEQPAKADPAHPDPSAEGDPFCEGIVDAAREQRYFLKQQELKALLASVDERLAVLEKKKAEYEEWVRRREDFAQRATKNLVEIYATMKPEAAASRIAALQTDLAASLLLAITPRQASAILNEMDEKVAASLTSIMAASARTKDPS